MKFVLGIGLLPDVSHALPLAIAAEQAGFHALQVGDSYFYPKHSDSKYPYYETDRSFIEKVPMYDPPVLLSAMAAVTKTLVLYPSVYKLASRHPILAAKQFSSLAVLSNNRILLGVGITPWLEDLTYLGIDWKTRGKRMDECMQIVRGILRGGYFEFHGEHFDFGPVKLNPIPTQPIPLIVGGHSEPALRRAAVLGDGWTSAGSSREELVRMIRRLGELRREHRRDKEPFQIHAGEPGLTNVDGFRQVEELGITHGVASVWNVYDPPSALQEKVDAVKRFGDQVIAKYR
jgi:probable F420-dependent oxidoreductase